MALWELVPVDSDTRHWCDSRYCGSALIRAHSEADARYLASLRFHAGPIIEGSRLSPENPWFCTQVVACRKVDDDVWPPDGEVRVLMP
jgi:hypothetical protein